MINTIRWSPNVDGDVVSYKIERAPVAAGPWTLVASVPHELSGQYWNAQFEKLEYNDDAEAEDYYRLTAVDADGLESAPTQPFQADATPPATDETIKVDHDYGSIGALKYMAPNGTPIEGAEVRVFRTPSMDTTIAFTKTNAYGQWIQPFYLVKGFTYRVQFFKEGAYGPDSVDIVV